MCVMSMENTQIKALFKKLPVLPIRFVIRINWKGNSKNTSYCKILIRFFFNHTSFFKRQVDGWVHSRRKKILILKMYKREGYFYTLKTTTTAYPMRIHISKVLFQPPTFLYTGTLWINIHFSVLYAYETQIRYIGFLL